jgi:hypothetical protein
MSCLAFNVLQSERIGWKVICRCMSNLLIIQFTDSLAEMMALPHQFCQRRETFHQLSPVVFCKARVSNNHVIMLAKVDDCSERGRGVIVSRQDDHLSISMILDGLTPTEGYCPFLSYKASLEAGCIEKRGCTGSVCGAGRRQLPQLTSLLDRCSISVTYPSDYIPEAVLILMGCGMNATKKTHSHIG